MADHTSSPPLAEAGQVEIGDDYLSPRSKVARMLADIDDAPTPSPPSRKPSPKAHAAKPDAAASGPFMDDSDEERSAVGSQQDAHQDGTQPEKSGEDEDEDEDDVLRKPMGRAARRMQEMEKEKTQQAKSSPAAQHNDSDEDLYSATPMRPSAAKRRREIFRRAASGSPLSVHSDRSNGLFVSPARTALAGSDDEDNLPANPLAAGGNKLAELVAQKRAERLAREAEQKSRQSRNDEDRSSAHASSDLPEEAFEHSQDAPANPDVDRILSDAARPTRKASKKAMLEMERETQRLARQQALAHQMKTKKKFSTNDLFAKFNFRQPQAAPNAEPSSSSAPNSDAADASFDSIPKEPVSTPPSSPPTPFDKQKMLVERGALAKMKPVRQDTIESIAADDDDLPHIDEMLKSSQRQKQQATVVEPSPAEEKGAKIARWGKKSVPQTYRDDSDDDLEIVQPLPKHLQAFERVKPAKQAEKHSNAIHTLRYLSHIGQNDAKPNRGAKVKPSVHPQVLEAQLRRKAREQAFQAQQERIAELKAKGIVVQTAEEREKEAEEFDNLLEKARQEAQDLKKAERAARKEAGDETMMQASDDESEDEDYAGSEDEEGEEESELQGNEGLVDDAAEEDEDEDDEEEVEPGTEGVAETQLDELDDAPAATKPASNASTPAKARAPRKSHVVMDEDDDDAEETIPPAAKTPAASNVATQNEDPFAAFGFGAGSAKPLMSPTQAFNATMQTPTQDSQQDSFDIMRHLRAPTMSSLPPTMAAGESQADNDESQTQLAVGPPAPESQEIQLAWESQAPETPAPGLVRKGSNLTETPGWEPSQDPGLPSPWTAVRRGQLRRQSTLNSVVEDEHETQSTVQLRVSETPEPSANVPKRGRLMQRKRIAADESDEESEQAAPSKTDAFREMKRRRMQLLNASEQAEAKAEMKRMMDEQAEESEDEYAGLGGDDTDQVAPETAEDQAMIDSSHIDVDERQIAAHYAERQRVAEEEATKKLYKDLTTGALRRRQGNDWNLDEDEDDLAVRRRQMRQREEARKRRLLLQDENVKGWAESGKQSKGKEAFLRALADDEEADDGVDLEEEEQEPAEESQSQTQTQQEPEATPLQEVSGNKRPLDNADEASQGRPPAKQRRTKAVDSALNRPTSMLEVRESLSFLLEEPAQATFGPSVLDQEPDSDADYSDEADLQADLNGEERPGHASDEEEIEAEAARQNDGGFAPNLKEMQDKAMMPPPRLPASQRRTAAKPSVIDRLSLKRGSSSSSSASDRSAWSTGSQSGSFRAPSLLRRATTNGSSGANERGVSIGKPGAAGGATKMGGSKKANLAYQARADERKAIVEASARRKAENTRKIAEMRRVSSGGFGGLGFGGDGFE